MVVNIVINITLFYIIIIMSEVNQEKSDFCAESNLISLRQSKMKKMFCVGLVGEKQISAYSICFQVEGFAWMVILVFLCCFI